MTSNKFKVYFVVIVAFALVLHLHGLSRADGETINKSTEKPISIKGLSIGMNINNARNTVINLLGKDYPVTQIGNGKDLWRDNPCLEEVLIFGNKERIETGVVGKRGFFIQNKNAACRGFISADDKDDKVTRISLSGSLVNLLYSASEINADDFVSQMESNFGLPGLPWIPYGWSYSSPNGYSLTIMTDKIIDIKKIDFHEDEKTKKIEF